MGGTGSRFCAAHRRGIPGGPGAAPVFIARFPKTRGALAAATTMAAEWSEPPFSPEIAADCLERWRDSNGGGAVILAALRDGAEAGMLCGKIGRGNSDGNLTAIAPLVWARRQGADGTKISPANRDAIAAALAGAFLEWARTREAGFAKIVFRPGMAPDANALARLGLRRMFDVCIRNAILPEDEIALRNHAGKRVGGTGEKTGVGSDDVEKWRAEAAEQGDPDWVERKIRERFGWPPLRGKNAPRPAEMLAAEHLDAATELIRNARNSRGERFDPDAFGEWFSAILRKRNACVLGAAAAGKLRGILHGRLVSHPHASGGLAVAAWMETAAAGMKSPRRVQDSLALGFARWAREAGGWPGVRTLCFALPVGGSHWSSFRERWHLRLAGNGFGRELESAENGL